MREECHCSVFTTPLVHPPRIAGHIPGKKEALQAFSISKNVAWNALTFRFEEIEKSINSTRDTPMNQRIRPSQLGVAFCDRPKSSELLHGVFLLACGKAFLESGPALHRLSS